jgi:hypothetical protein
MRFVIAILVLLAAGFGAAFAASVPLPRPRPVAPALPPEPPLPPDFAIIAAELGLDPAEITSEPTECDRRLEQMAKFDLMPRLIGPGACGGRDLVQIEAIVLPDKTRVAVHPTALLTCPMAESLAAWLRDEVAPRLAEQGARLRSIENYDAYSCRTRNRIPGAKLSQHAHGEAIDVRAFLLADGRRLEPTDPKVDQPLRVAWRDSACRRFTTVLGPGDANHSGHIHLDILSRRNGYRICQWEVREPVPVVPLPRPRPTTAAAPIRRGGLAGRSPTL